MYFIIRSHPFVFNNYTKIGEMTKEEVNGFREYCLNAVNIDLDGKDVKNCLIMLKH